MSILRPNAREKVINVCFNCDVITNMGRLLPITAKKRFNCLCFIYKSILLFFIVQREVKCIFLKVKETLWLSLFELYILFDTTTGLSFRVLKENSHSWLSAVISVRKKYFCYILFNISWFDYSRWIKDTISLVYKF